MLNTLIKKMSQLNQKLYEKLPDLGERINDNDDLSKLDEETKNKENMKKNAIDIINIIKKESGVTKDSKSSTMKGAEIIQKLFYGFLIIIGILLFLFLAFLYYRYKHRPENLSSEYFLKKANELTYKI